MNEVPTTATSIPPREYGATPDTTQSDFHQLKDPIKQAQMRQQLTTYLTQHNYQAETQRPLSPETTSSPTQEDVEAMFRFLYHRIDPTHRFEKGLDVEVPPLLGKMGYPYKNTICKAHLVAVDDGRLWPGFVVMLHWMMLLAKDGERHSSGRA
ncbi:hypothetical protein M409DRAFT_23079 [Zasmidium cellare ATCC 36951]|uniref:Kinetochore protein NDC80 n=1 Tax=Zasmidium cellare ATCC 36951 TaxID=1080233 RepID=A0A6A6CGR9_ZASCE|nr:uncharacterized protein M409DRAFT_23079 [Zasmidium cellare ATCC 36951]KAF2166437.1 hypothetical protein M409DRAFT_23079 [Zasmidium cellare ATCC 36951]